ncbi:LysR substrate-binding domain-containing protein [Pseudomonas sp. LP_7_YM]|uniref:LysR substrate-binding domain-containing protein n=1 Tax=Pseudomonas sp. LP_7_YM TaxID=2485137 RepID=UPI00105DECE2|nr:LysR substrate-binding domain-containing protein [Pseudomonas sp. LP_7_YM]TDV67775.1 LysR family transcriptional regulator [Pseudomonas sp. LP_7_YM]
MNLRQLEAFRAVILGQTVTRAAEMLHISQPAATRLIASLEEDIGFTLFDRIKGRLQPTAEAMTLYQEVQRSLVGVERIARTAQDIRSLKRGSLHIACAPAMGLVFLPRVIAAFMAEHDGVQISLVVHSSSEVIDLVVGQRCDLGIIVLPNTYPSPRSEKLLATRMLCALPAGHRLCDKPLIVPEDLRGERFISFPHSIGSRQQIDTIFAAHGVERELRLETQLSQPMCEFVEHGLGVALVDVLSAVNYRGTGIVFKAFDPAIEMDFSMLLPVQGPASKLQTAFLEHTQAFISRQVPKAYRF